MDPRAESLEKLQLDAIPDRFAVRVEREPQSQPECCGERREVVDIGAATSLRSSLPAYEREMPAAEATVDWLNPSASLVVRRSAATSASDRRAARRPRV